MTVYGAWCRRPSFADVDFAASIGLRRLDVMVNDLSKARSPTKFVVDWSADKYLNIVGKASQHDIEVHFTSWVMPHVEFCKRAADGLQQLALDTGANGLMFDAEEPWTQAHQPQYWEASDALHTGLAGCRYGVTGIGWASKWLERLVAQADYHVPQLYATSGGKLQPREFGGPMQHWARWQPDAYKFVPALAAYRTTPALFRASVAEVSPCPTILLWALRHIRAKTGAAVRKVIADLARAKEAA